MSARPDPGFWAGRSVCVTGGAGFLGKPTVRLLEEAGAEVSVPRSADHDLRDKQQALAALEGAEVVLHLAANVGGIGYNRRNPGPLIADNTAMALNVFEACRVHRPEKLVAVCSVCAYPKYAPVPFREEEIWSGYPEESNAPYGVAKRHLITLADAFQTDFDVASCVPVLANLYGPDDNFDLEDSHVIAALVHKFVIAKESGQSTVTLWGTGQPSREFLYVDDAARALVLAAERCRTCEPFNVGTGIETRIVDLAEAIREIVGFDGGIAWDSSRPDGQPSRYLDVSRAREWIDFEAETPLSKGLRATVESFRRQMDPAPAR